MGTTEKKHEQRKEMRRRIAECRQQIELWLREERAAAARLLTSEWYARSSHILAYAATPDEFSLDGVIERAMKDGKTVALPKCNPKDCTMEFYRLENSLSLAEQLAAGSYGIREPISDLERLSVPALPAESLVLIPGLAFTPQGQRLGKGKGFYDKYLARILSNQRDETAGPVLMGVCHPCQVVETVATEPTDVALAFLLAGGEILRCGKGCGRQ